jgi:hypothetical protein
MIAVQWDDGTRQLINVQELMSEKLYNDIKEAERASNMALKPTEAVLDAVVFQAGHSAPLTKGKIGGPLNGSHVLVEWDNGHISKVDIKHLLSEVAGSAENQRLTDESERLEREWEAVESACTEKLKQAADLINEASGLAGSKGKDLTDLRDAVYPLERAMGNAGWRTSSWNC